MSFIDKFKTQHNEILAVAGDISKELKAGGDAAVLRKHLSLLAGKLSFHLALEDKSLYPRMIASSDAQAQVLARKFMAEMGGLGQAFTSYNSKWQVSAIRADLPGFSSETRDVFAALTQRIARENRELYPLAERAG